MVIIILQLVIILLSARMPGIELQQVATIHSLAIEVDIIILLVNIMCFQVFIPVILISVRLAALVADRAPMAISSLKQ